MSDYDLFPASLCKIRAYSVWADKDSRMNLADRTYTYINLRVQCLDGSKFTGLDMYGLDTVIL